MGAFLPDPSNPTNFGGPLGKMYEYFRSKVYAVKLQAADTLTANRTIKLPDATGTLALTAGAQTWTGTQTFTDAVALNGATTFGVGGSATFNCALKTTKPSIRVSAAAVAAGSTTTDALVLGISNAVFVVTAADGAKGVRLTAIATDAEVKVINNAAAVLKIYPPTGGTINGGSADASISVSANRTALLHQISASAWTALFN